MKQTKNAIKFMMAQYRAILMSSLIRSILSSSSIAALAAASICAQAATDSWSNLSGYENLSAEQTFSGSGTISNSHGFDLRVSSGGELAFTGTATASGNFTVATGRSSTMFLDGGSIHLGGQPSAQGQGVSGATVSIDRFTAASGELSIGVSSTAKSTSTLNAKTIVLGSKETVGDMFLEPAANHSQAMPVVGSASPITNSAMAMPSAAHQAAASPYAANGQLGNPAQYTLPATAAAPGPVAAAGAIAAAPAAAAALAAPALGHVGMAVGVPLSGVSAQSALGTLDIVIGESGALGGADTTDVLIRSGNITFSGDTKVNASNAVAITGGQVQTPEATKTVTLNTPKLELSNGAKLITELNSKIKIGVSGKASTVILGKGTVESRGGDIDLGTSGGTLLMMASDFDNNTGIFRNRGGLTASGATADKTYSIIAVGDGKIDLGIPVREADGTKFTSNIDIGAGKLVIAADDAQAFFSGSKLGYLSSGSFKELEAGKDGELTIDATALTIRESLTVPSNAASGDDEFGTLTLDKKASLVLDGAKGKVNAKSITVGSATDSGMLTIKSGVWNAKGISVKSGTATVHTGSSLNLLGGELDANNSGQGKVVVKGLLDASEVSKLGIKSGGVLLAHGGTMVLNQPDVFSFADAASKSSTSSTNAAKTATKSAAKAAAKAAPSTSSKTATAMQEQAVTVQQTFAANAISGDKTSVVLFTNTTAPHAQTISVAAAKDLATKLKTMNSFIQFDEAKLRIDRSSAETGVKQFNDIKDGSRIIGLYKDVTLRADDVSEMTAVGNIKLESLGLREFTVKDTSLVLNNASANLGHNQLLSPQGHSLQLQVQQSMTHNGCAKPTMNMHCSLPMADAQDQAHSSTLAQLKDHSRSYDHVDGQSMAYGNSYGYGNGNGNGNGYGSGHVQGNKPNAEQDQGAAGIFVRDSKDAVAGLRLSGAASAVTLNGRGQIGSINASKAGEGTVLIGSPAYASSSAVDVMGSIGGEKSVAAVLVDRNASLAIHAGKDKEALRTSSLFVAHGGSINASGQNITVGAREQTTQVGGASNDADSVAIINGSLKAKTLNLLGKSGQHHTIGGGAYVEVDRLNAADGVSIDIGQESGPLAKTTVLASHLRLNGSKLNLNHDTAREYVTTSTLNLAGAKGNLLDGKVLVGNNTVFAVGLPHTDIDKALQRLVLERKFTDFSPPVGTAAAQATAHASNALILNKGISIDAKSGGLYVGPVPTTQVDSNSVTFDANSALIITDKAFAKDASGKKVGSAITLNAPSATRTASAAAPAAGGAVSAAAAPAAASAAAAPATGAAVSAGAQVAAAPGAKLSVSPTANLLLLGKFNGGDKNLSIVDGVSPNEASQLDNFNVFTATDLLDVKMQDGKLSFSLTKDQRLLAAAFNDAAKPIKTLLIDVLDGSEIESRSSPAHDFLNEIAVSTQKQGRLADAAAHALTYAGSQQVDLAVVGTMTDAIAARVASVGFSNATTANKASYQEAKPMAASSTIDSNAKQRVASSTADANAKQMASSSTTDAIAQAVGLSSRVGAEAVETTGTNNRGEVSKSSLAASATADAAQRGEATSVASMASSNEATKVDHSSKSGVWVSPVYKAVDSYGFASQGSIFGADINLAGMALGADTVKGNLRFGTVFNIGSGKSLAKGNGSGLKDEFNYYGIGMYTAMGFENFSLVADASMNVISHDVEGLALKAKADTTALSMGVTGQYTINNPWVDVTTHLGARFIRLDTDSYKLRSEQGVIASTDFEVQNIISVPLGLTLSKTYSAKDWLIAPSADLSITFNTRDTDAKFATDFIGVRSIALNAEVMDEVSYGINLGLAAQYGAFGTHIGLNYLGSDNSESISVNAQARFVF